jgi:uncharacterized protein YbjT (DUF2867 family)
MEPDSNKRTIVVFGGSGFLGRHIVCHLRRRELSARVASRDANRSREIFGADDPQIHFVPANIHDEGSVAHALAGAYGVVNAVSLYVEHGRETFDSVHVVAARRLAAQARETGVQRLVHVSGIGSDPGSPSLYIRKRGEGEIAVRHAFPDAVIVRPAVMFGEDDAFLAVILKLLRQLPIYPMFGRGLTRLQPAHVDNVGQAIAAALQQPALRGTIFECAGPHIYSYEQLLRAVADAAGLKPILLPMPFAAWHALAWFAERLPNPPVTRNQVELMQVDTVSSSGALGFKELGVSPRSVEEVIRNMLREAR